MITVMLQLQWQNYAITIINRGWIGQKKKVPFFCLWLDWLYEEKYHKLLLWIEVNGIFLSAENQMRFRHTGT